MKALLIKDFAYFQSYWKQSLAGFAFFFVVQILIKNYTFAFFFIAWMFIMIPQNTFYYDDLNHTKEYCLGLPFTKKEWIRSRYLFGILFMAVSALFIVLGLGIAIFQKMMDFRIGICIFLAFLSLNILVNAITYPILFRYEYSKAKFFSLFVYGLLLLRTFAILRSYEPENLNIANFFNPQILLPYLLGAFVVSVILFIFSEKISYRICP